MLVEPLAMQAEAQSLVAVGVADPFAHTSIDEAARVTTPFHRAINRRKEAEASYTGAGHASG
jgi:adenylosuccinate synthase